MLNQWRLLQSKKQSLEEQQPRRDIKTEVKQHLATPSDDFERIMEEDLGRQLEALELEEEEQYQRMKKSIEEDLKQRSRFEAEAREQWALMNELDRLEDEEKKQRQKLEANGSKNGTHDNQRKLWRQKQMMYVRQAMQKAVQLKARKMLQLLESYHKSKTYHFQRANSKKWSR